MIYSLLNMVHNFILPLIGNGDVNMETTMEEIFTWEMIDHPVSLDMKE